MTVRGRDDENTLAVAEDSHTLQITNSCADARRYQDAPATIAEGNQVTYSFTITNTSPASTDPVTVTSVLDNVLGDLTSSAIQANGGNPIVLASGASFTFTYTTALVLNAGTVSNTVNVLGVDDENSQAAAQDGHTLTVADVAPSIAVDKNGPTTLPEGQTATYSFTITNTSTAVTDPVTITSVVDNVLGDLTAAANAAWLAQGNTGPILLAPGSSFTFSTTTAAPLTPAQ